MNATGPYAERDEAAVKDLQSSVVAKYDAAHLARSLRAIATWTIPLNDPLGRAVLREAAARVESSSDSGASR